MTDVVEEIRRAQLDPRAVAAALGLQVARGPRAHGRVLVSCPWHAERTPSCSLRARDGRLVAYCHGCHEGGDLFDLVAAVRGLDVQRDFRRVLEVAGELAGVDVTREAPRRRAPRRRPTPAVSVADALERLAEDVVAGRAISARARRDLDRAVVTLLRRADTATVGEVLGEALADLSALDQRLAGVDELELQVDELEASGELRRRESELDGLGFDFAERDLARLEISLALAELAAA